MFGLPAVQLDKMRKINQVSTVESRVVSVSCHCWYIESIDLLMHCTIVVATALLARLLLSALRNLLAPTACHVHQRRVPFFLLFAETRGQAWFMSQLLLYGSSIVHALIELLDDSVNRIPSLLQTPGTGSGYRCPRCLSSCRCPGGWAQGATACAAADPSLAQHAWRSFPDPCITGAAHYVRTYACSTPAHTELGVGTYLMCRLHQTHPPVHPPRPQAAWWHLGQLQGDEL